MNENERMNSPTPVPVFIPSPCPPSLGYSSSFLYLENIKTVHELFFFFFFFSLYKMMIPSASTCPDVLRLAKSAVWGTVICCSSVVFSTFQHPVSSTGRCLEPVGCLVVRGVFLRQHHVLLDVRAERMILIAQSNIQRQWNGSRQKGYLQ